MELGLFLPLRSHDVDCLTDWRHAKSKSKLNVAELLWHQLQYIWSELNTTPCSCPSEIMSHSLQKNIRPSPPSLFQANKNQRRLTAHHAAKVRETEVFAKPATCACEDAGTSVFLKNERNELNSEAVPLKGQGGHEPPQPRNKILTFQIEPSSTFH